MIVGAKVVNQTKISKYNRSCKVVKCNSENKKVSIALVHTNVNCYIAKLSPSSNLIFGRDGYILNLSVRPPIRSIFILA